MSFDITDAGADLLDVRDIIARVEALEEAQEQGDLNAEEMEEGELKTLSDFLASIAGYGGDEEWRGVWYPVTLIRDSYFEEAMDDQIADCYDLPDLPSFMTITLDYDALRMDYTSDDLCGVTYWMR